MGRYISVTESFWVRLPRPRSSWYAEIRRPEFGGLGFRVQGLGFRV